MIMKCVTTTALLDYYRVYPVGCNSKNLVTVQHSFITYVEKFDQSGK